MYFQVPISLLKGLSPTWRQGNTSTYCNISLTFLQTFTFNLTKETQRKVRSGLSLEKSEILIKQEHLVLLNIQGKFTLLVKRMSYVEIITAVANQESVLNSQIYWIYWWHIFDVNCGTFWTFLHYKYVQGILCKISCNVGTFFLT